MQDLNEEKLDRKLALKSYLVGKRIDRLTGSRSFFYLLL